MREFFRDSKAGCGMIGAEQQGRLFYLAGKNGAAASASK